MSAMSSDETQTSRLTNSQPVLPFSQQQHSDDADNGETLCCEHVGEFPAMQLHTNATPTAALQLVVSDDESLYCETCDATPTPAMQLAPTEETQSCENTSATPTLLAPSAQETQYCDNTSATPTMQLTLSAQETLYCETMSATPTMLAPSAQETQSCENTSATPTMQLTPSAQEALYCVTMSATPTMQLTPSAQGTQYCETMSATPTMQPCLSTEETLYCEHAVATPTLQLPSAQETLYCEQAVATPTMRLVASSAGSSANGVDFCFPTMQPSPSSEESSTEDETQPTPSTRENQYCENTGATPTAHLVPSRQLEEQLEEKQLKLQGDACKELYAGMIDVRAEIGVDDLERIVAKTMQVIRYEGRATHGLYIGATTNLIRRWNGDDGMKGHKDIGGVHKSYMVALAVVCGKRGGRLEKSLIHRFLAIFPKSASIPPYIENKSAHSKGTLNGPTDVNFVYVVVW